MMKHGTWLAAVAMLMPIAAQAQSAGAVDLYYVGNAGIEVNSAFVAGENDGDGFGAKGIFKVADGVALSGEYQSVSYDDTDGELDQTRLGIGFVGESMSGIFIGFDQFDFDGDEVDGFSVRARLAGDVAPGFQLYGDVGYGLLETDDEDVDALEFTIGAVFSLNPQAGIFVDYRVTNLEGQDTGAEIDLDDLRVGLRLAL